MVVESPAGRMADENGQIVSARSLAAVSTLDSADEPSQSATLDVIRPPFASHNTSVLIINENGPEMPTEGVSSLAPPAISHEEEGISLRDIPLLADQTNREYISGEGQPLLSSLNQLQSLILKHFALLQLQKSGIGHLIELDEVLELLEVRKSQWWNKIFKGPNKKDQKKKGEPKLVSPLKSRCIRCSYRDTRRTDWLGFVSRSF